MRRSATKLITAMAGTAAVAMAAPAAAMAQATIVIDPVKECYLSGEPVLVTGTGYTPAGPVALTFDGAPLLTGTADAAGVFSADGGINEMRGVKTHAMTATDQTNPALTATVSFFGTTNTVSVKPRRGSAGTTRRIKGSGFVGGPRVYMHVRGRGYKTDRRIARTTGPCGAFAVRTKIVPAGAGTGNYTVQFDGSKRYSKNTVPAFRGRLRVYPVASSSSARAAVAGTVHRWTRLSR